MILVERGERRESGVRTVNSHMTTLGLISQRLFGLSHGINTLIAYGIAKHKMNVKG